MAEIGLKEKTAKGLFWGGISNGIQQLLGVVIGIVLLKNLTPDDYGMVGMLAIFTAIASTIQESGFTAALTNRPEFKDEDYTSVFWFNFIVGSIIYVILFFCAPLIADFYRQPELILLSRVLFLSILIGSLGIAHNAVLFRKLMVRERAIIDISSICIAGLIGVYMALTEFGYWALAIQTLIYSIAGTIFRWIFSPWRPNFRIDFGPVKEMFGFSISVLFSTIMGQIQANIFSVILGKFSTKTALGYFSQGVKWSGMVSLLTNGMITGVTQPLFSIIIDNSEKKIQVFRKMTRFIAFVAFPLLLGLAFVCEEFILIVNSDWLPCVPIMQIFCVWEAIVPLQTLYIYVIISHNRPNIYMYCSVLVTFFLIFTTIILLPYGIYWMAFGLVVVKILFLFVYHFHVSKLIKIKLLNILMDMFPYLLITLSVFGAIELLIDSIDNNYFRLILKIFFSGVLYCVIMYYTKSVIFSELLKYLKDVFFKYLNISVKRVVK